VGKTRLATEVAFHARTRFPDGVWFVDLAPITSSDSIPALLANTFALRPIADTPIVTVILDHLAASRLLIILDNCEHLLADTAALVDMILDATDGVQVVATSREPLDVDGEYRYPLAPMGVPAPGCSAAEFVESAAAALFLARLAHGRSGLDLDGGDAEAIARICAAVGGLPLGIELAAARARTFDLDAIVASLEQSPAHLARNGPGPQRHSNMLNTVDWGYRLAGNDEQVLHSRLAVFPGAFTLEAAAVLCSFAPLSAAQALDLVGGLAHRSLLVAVAPEARGRKTTFAQLVPIRAHADHTLTGSERTKAEVARDRWVIERILSAPAPGGADQPAYYDWIEDNEAIVRAVLRSTLVERRDVVGLTLLSRMIFFWHDREQIVEMLRWTDLAETYFRTASLDDSKRAALDAVTGCAQALAHNTDAAERLLGLAVPVLENPPDDHVQESTRLLFVVAVCAWSGDVFDWSTRAATAVVELSLRVADIHTELGARGVLAAAALITGDSESALSRASAILADNVIVGNNFAALFANITYSIAAKFAGDGITGLRYSDEVLRTQKRLGTHNFSESFETRANHLVNAGQLDEGARYLGLSYALSQRQGRDWPWHPGTDEQVSELRETLGAEFDEHWNSGVRMGQVDPSQLLSDLELSTVGETGSSRVDRPSRVP
jgi:predicted ATPase